MRREIHSEDVEVTLPTGDSYDLSLEETRLYLTQLGVPFLRGDKALDKLWNFYAIRLHLDGDEYRAETIEAPQYPEVGGPRPLEEHAWIIESGRVV